MEGGVGNKTGVALQQPGEEHEVQQALLLAVEKCLHQAEVLQYLNRKRHVSIGETRPVRRAEHHLVIQRHDVDVLPSATTCLIGAAEQTVAIERGPCRRLGRLAEILHHRAGNAAHKVGGKQAVAVQPVRQAIVRCGVVEG